MEGNYEVKFGAEKVGKVQVLRQGLYFRFICHCKIPSDMVVKLVIRCGGKSDNIGVLIPFDEDFQLDKKYPVKKFSQGTPEFYLAPRHDTVNGKFVPIYPEEPFAYIARLKDAFLATQSGQVGVMLKENKEFEYDLL